MYIYITMKNIPVSRFTNGGFYCYIYVPLESEYFFQENDTFLFVLGGTYQSFLSSKTRTH